MCLFARLFFQEGGGGDKEERKINTKRQLLCVCPNAATKIHATPTKTTNRVLLLLLVVVVVDGLMIKTTKNKTR